MVLMIVVMTVLVVVVVVIQLICNHLSLLVIFLTKYRFIIQQ